MLKWPIFIHFQGVIGMMIVNNDGKLFSHLQPFTSLVFRLVKSKPKSISLVRYRHQSMFFHFPFYTLSFCHAPCMVATDHWERIEEQVAVAIALSPDP